MTEQHPTTPSLRLLNQWLEDWHQAGREGTPLAYVASRAAQWGYQQAIEELEAFLRKGHD